jgi:2-C-methyl-D-erythritol 4-phosphate cytidylyltransferase/2-C-methyl-D-erythritol 2,4-cyclodiphosphate synthase
MNIAIIVAAGTSSRFGKKTEDKLLADAVGFPVIYHTIRAFHDHPQIGQVYIVAGKSNKKKIQDLIKKFHFPRIKAVVLGGKERQDSVKKGLKAIKNPKPNDIILIHNGANPLVTEQEITKTIDAAKKYGAAAVGKKMVDTVKEIKSGHIVKTHDRNNLAGMQTPQAAKYSLFKKAFQQAAKERKFFTDDAAFIENLGHKVKLIPASEHNFKITTEHDLEKVRHVLGDTPNGFLVGLGQDSHQFSDSKKGLYLGGIVLKDQPKLEAESDGDVILHALYNAISQALGDGSLGLFATQECRIKGSKSSSSYLRPLFTKLKRRKYELNNIGIMIECARPKIDPLSTQIKKSLSRITGLPARRIGITATTGEKLTSFGKGKGIQCFAIVSLKKSSLNSYNLKLNG